MHYTGTIWRPPYEAGSLLLEVTAGCTHHRCKFCTLYRELPFPFRMSPLETVEADLLEAQTAMRSLREGELLLRGLGERPQIKRVFLTGGNPFALEFRRLRRIGELVRQYFPECETIGCFARVTDVAHKSGEELEQLARLGYNGISIGVETGDDKALAFMDKGYEAADILRETKRLEEATTFCTWRASPVPGGGRRRRRGAPPSLTKLTPASSAARCSPSFPIPGCKGRSRRGTGGRRGSWRSWRSSAPWWKSFPSPSGLPPWAPPTQSL